MSLLTKKSDIALPLRLAAFRSALPIAQLLNILNPLKYIEHQPVIYCLVDGCPKPVPSYELSGTLNKCAGITDEKKSIAELPPEWFLLMSQLDKFTFSIIDEYMDRRDEYVLPSNIDDFPYQELLGECKHILELDVALLFNDQNGPSQQAGSVSVPLVDDETNNNVFRKLETRTWEVIFEGRKYSNLEHREGFNYIRVLLGQPNKEFTVNDFEPAIVSVSPETTDAILEGDLSEQDLFSGHDDSADATAITEYKQRIESLTGQIDEAELSHDDELKHKLEDELDTLNKEIVSATSRSLPRDKSIQKKRQDSIRANIQNAIDYVTEYCPDFGAHLQTSIKKGASNSYKPDSDFDWTVI